MSNPNEIERLRKFEERYGDRDVPSEAVDEFYFEELQEDLPEETASLIEEMNKKQLRGLVARLYKRMETLVRSATHYNKHHDHMQDMNIRIDKYMQHMCWSYSPCCFPAKSSEKAGVGLTEKAISKGSIIKDKNDD